MHRLRCLAAVAATTLAVPVAAQEPPAGPLRKLNDTGMNYCVVGGAFSRDCAGTGQDAAYGLDAAAPRPGDGRAGFRFTRVCGSGEAAGRGSCPMQPALGTGSNQWACTYDRVTGLLWEIKTTDGSARDMSQRYAVQDWSWAPYYGMLLDALNGPAVCGQTRWSLPTFTELQSLVDYGRRNAPAIDPAYFPNTVAGEYHTPNPLDMPNETTIQTVDFKGGGYGNQYPGEGYFVRLVVRPADLPQPAVRFKVIEGGHAVLDRWTNLVWRRCGAGAEWNGSTCEAVGQTGFTWLEAQSAGAAAGPGWRLPNVKELTSLADAHSGDLDRTAFPGRGPWDGSLTWSSTIGADRPDRAWQVGFYPAYGFDPRTAPTADRLGAYLVREP